MTTPRAEVMLWAETRLVSVGFLWTEKRGDIDRKWAVFRAGTTCVLIGCFGDLQRANNAEIPEEHVARIDQAYVILVDCSSPVRGRRKGKTQEEHAAFSSYVTLMLSPC